MPGSLAQETPLRTLAALYAALPALACQGRCQAVCGPVTATPLERDQILRVHHRALAPDHTGRRCRLLTEAGACAVYADRPLVCRVVGLTKETACPHGCVPERWLTDAEVYTGFFKPLFALNGGRGG